MKLIKENKLGAVALVAVIIGLIIGFCGSWFSVFVALGGAVIACYDWYLGMKKENTDLKTYLPVALKQKLLTVVAIAAAALFLLFSVEIVSVAKAENMVDEAWDAYEEAWDDWVY